MTAELNVAIQAKRWAKAPMSLIVESVKAPPWTLQVYAYLDAQALSRGWWACTQGDLATALGIPRPAVSRAVRWLTGNGYLGAERFGRYETKFVLHATRGAGVSVRPEISSEQAPVRVAYSESPKVIAMRTASGGEQIASRTPSAIAPLSEQRDLRQRDQEAERGAAAAVTSKGFAASVAARPEPAEDRRFRALTSMFYALRASALGIRDETMLRLASEHLTDGDIERLTAKNAESWPLLRAIIGDAVAARMRGVEPRWFGGKAASSNAAPPSPSTAKGIAANVVVGVTPDGQLVRRRHVDQGHLDDGTKLPTEVDD